MSANELSKEQIDEIADRILGEPDTSDATEQDFDRKMNRRFARAVIKADRSLRSPAEPDSVHQAVPSTPAPVGDPSVRAGFIKVYVTGFSELMEALDRAERKGYMPDAMLDEWSAFDYRPDKPPDMTPPALPQAADRHVGDSDFESWYANWRETEGRSLSAKQMMRDAYAAGMGDGAPVPQAAEQAEPVAWEWFDSKGEHRLTSTEPADYELAVRVTPFYAHPAPQVNQAVPGDAVTPPSTTNKEEPK